MKYIKMVLTFALTMALILGTSTSAFASENTHSANTLINIDVSENIGFVLYQNEHDIDNVITRAKSYTSDSYSGYFYFKDSGAKISEHTFTSKFSYDGTLATCYETSSSCKMIDNTSNLRPKATSEGRNNVTPTKVYGYVTFTLYNSDDSVNSEVSVKIYCNQKGETWVNRQG